MEPSTGPHRNTDEPESCWLPSKGTHPLLNQEETPIVIFNAKSDLEK
jgi:hypothetical protein